MENNTHLFEEGRSGEYKPRQRIGSFLMSLFCSGATKVMGYITITG